jgi:hypothetical protein
MLIFESIVKCLKSEMYKFEIFNIKKTKVEIEFFEMITKLFFCIGKSKYKFAKHFLIYQYL